MWAFHNKCCKYNIVGFELKAPHGTDTECLVAIIITVTPMYPQNARQYTMPSITKGTFIAT
jgi:hypothetical protein